MAKIIQTQFIAEINQQIYSYPFADLPKPEKPAPLPVRESETPLIGYRAWDVIKDEDRFWLKSPYQSTIWDGPILRAEKPPCAYDPHGYWKDENHSHGIYAHNEPVWEDMHTYDWMRGPMFSGTAMGRVELTGRVIVHETGFRAEAARITKLVLSPSLMKLKPEEQLAARYACDVSYDPRTLEEL